MLNIMPMNTAIKPQFVYNFIIFDDYIRVVRFQINCDQAWKPGLIYTKCDPA